MFKVMLLEMWDCGEDIFKWLVSGVICVNVVKVFLLVEVVEVYCY